MKPIFICDILNYLLGAQIITDIICKMIQFPIAIATYIEKLILCSIQNRNGWIKTNLLSSFQSQISPKEGYDDGLKVARKFDPLELNLNPGEIMTAEKYCHKINKIHRLWQSTHSEAISFVSINYLKFELSYCVWKLMLTIGHYFCNNLI